MSQRARDRAAQSLVDWLQPRLQASSPLPCCWSKSLLLGVAAVIWHCDGAPVLFGHYRVGRNSRVPLPQFRAMYGSQQLLAGC
jgi:hypothetical protein